MVNQEFKLITDSNIDPNLVLAKSTLGEQMKMWSWKMEAGH